MGRSVYADLLLCHGKDDFVEYAFLTIYFYRYYMLNVFLHGYKVEQVV